MTPLAANLEFVFKALSINRARLAQRLEIDKSAIGRWFTGAVRPSPENLARVTALVAERVEGFSVLDWDRDLETLAAVMGVQPPAGAKRAAPRFGDGLPLVLLEQSAITTALRGGAYEGFFRSTRPYAQRPGAFIHDHVMLWRDETGLLRVRQKTGGVLVEGWALLLRDQIFIIGEELTSGSLVFAILNGVNTLQAGLVDGLILNCALDQGATPTAFPAIFERIGDLSGDLAKDNDRFERLAAVHPVAPEGSLSLEIRAHLDRDAGPTHLAEGGDWLMRLPRARSMARGLIP